MSKLYKELRFLVDLRKKPLPESKLPNEWKPLLFLILCLIGHRILNDIDWRRIFAIEHYLAENAVHVLFILIFTKILMTFLLGDCIRIQISYLMVFVQFIDETRAIICELIESQYNTLQAASIAEEKSLIENPKIHSVIVEEIEVYHLTLPRNINKEESSLVNNAFTATPLLSEAISTTTTTTITPEKEVNNSG